MERLVSSPVVALGSATLIDGLATMSGAATMKMTSSTSVTSTIGVTLMAANIPTAAVVAIRTAGRHQALRRNGCSSVRAQPA